MRELFRAISEALVKGEPLHLEFTSYGKLWILSMTQKERSDV